MVRIRSKSRNTFIVQVMRLARCVRTGNSFVALSGSGDCMYYVFILGRLRRAGGRRRVGFEALPGYLGSLKYSRLSCEFTKLRKKNRSPFKRGRERRGGEPVEVTTQREPCRAVPSTRFPCSHTEERAQRSAAQEGRSPLPKEKYMASFQEWLRWLLKRNSGQGRDREGKL